MVFEYGSKKYEELIKNFKELLIDNKVEINREKDLISLVKVLKKSFTEDYHDVFPRLNEMNLKFNSWNGINEAINANLISTHNLYLLKVISKDTDLSNISIRDIIEALYLVLYADIYEASLIASDTYLRNSLDKLSQEFTYVSYSLSSDSLKRLHYLWFLIPKEVFTKHLNHHLDKDVIETVAKLQENDEFLEKKLQASQVLKDEISIIQDSLNEQKTEYNFVGLSNGFMSLKNQKKKELCWQHIFYYSLILTILCLIIWKFTWTVKYLESSNLNETIFITTTISSFLVILLLLYFFKITLNNVKNLKSQILQIDLRLTLCQFIHNYNTDTTTLRSEDMKDSFDKFESVIFAPIMPTDEKIPSTFDGLEQITKIVSEFKK